MLGFGEGRGSAVLSSHPVLCVSPWVHLCAHLTGQRCCVQVAPGLTEGLLLAALPALEEPAPQGVEQK